ncbi:RidA family protein [Amycolatopsis sp. NPDC023774]|uniref:RidA family protein n=1 Tax=Amycolatopsis sp. NPDC023774 TaxID=3155015 RepID=UPI00340AC0AB
MTIQRQNPPAPHATPGYHHVTAVSGRTTVHLAGQCPLGLDGLIVAGDVLAQADQVVADTATALRAAGATADDVLRTVSYVATADRAVLFAVWDQFTGSAIGPAFSTASTLLGVTCLEYSGQLVELDITAAVS